MDILKKNKYKHIIYSAPTIIILLLLIVFVGRATWNVFEKQQETQKKLALAQQEKVELEERHVGLETKLEQLETRHGVEEEIREKFGVAKEGEKVVYLVEEDKEREGKQATSSVSWWKKVLRVFDIF